MAAGVTVALILQAIKAIPEIVVGLKEVASQINKLRDSLTDKKFDEIKTEVRETLEEIKNAKNNKDRLKLIEDLNNKLSR